MSARLRSPFRKGGPFCGADGLAYMALGVFGDVDQKADDGSWGGACVPRGAVRLTSQCRAASLLFRRF